MIIDLKNNMVYPSKGKLLVRKIDGCRCLEHAILGEWEIRGKVYNLTADSYKEEDL